MAQPMKAPVSSVMRLPKATSTVHKVARARRTTRRRGPFFTAWKAARVGLLACWACGFSLLVPPAWLLAQTPGTAPAKEQTPAPKHDGKQSAWVPLFDGKSLAGWKVSEFGAQGSASVEKGELVLQMGYPMSGITSTRKDLPRDNYEIRLEAARLDGIDFFCGLTFPVQDAHCSLIIGGWSGGVVGLSSIDGHDASENETTHFMSFDDKKWYPIRLRVETERIQAWIEGKQIVDVETKGKKFSTRNEVDLSKPLGFSTFETTAGLRKIEMRRLQPSTKKSK